MDWMPANEAERRMHAAARAGDLDGYLAVLCRTALLLPGQVPAPGRPQEFVTWRAGGRTYLLVFTSPQAMAGTGTGGVLATSLAELMAKWPDPAWLLAVDANLPIAAVFSHGWLADRLAPYQSPVPEPVPQPPVPEPA